MLYMKLIRNYFAMFETIKRVKKSTNLVLSNDFTGITL